MAQKNRTDLQNQITTNINTLNVDTTTKVTDNIVGSNTGANLQDLLLLLNSTLQLFEVDVVDSSFNLSTDSTSVITEGTNLFFTDARADSRVNTLRPTQGAITSPSGGLVQDVEARAAIDELRAALTASNITA